MESIEIAWRYIKWIAHLGDLWVRQGSDIPCSVQLLVDRAVQGRLSFNGRKIRVISQAGELQAYREAADHAEDSKPVVPLIPSSHRPESCLWLLKPALRFSESEDEGPSWCSVRIMRYCSYEDGLRCYGFRFDAPESAGDRNPFVHLQLIADSSSLGWVSERIPAIPVHATEPHELVLSALVAIYSIKGLSDIVRKQPSGEISGQPKECLRKYCERLMVS